MAEWTHRICERCWFDGTTIYRDRIVATAALELEPPGWLDDGNEFPAYRQPVQLKDPEPGACCVCGGMTITGIYFRRAQEDLLCQGRHEDLSWSRVGRA